MLRAHRPPEVLVFCPNCGAQNTETAQTCTKCAFALKTAECLASCGSAPMMQVDQTYYENLTPADVDKILEQLQRD